MQNTSVYTIANEWGRWRRLFEQFCMASGLDQQGEERQVCTLMYCLGEGAEGILSPPNISEANRKKYSAVLSKIQQVLPGAEECDI